MKTYRRFENRPHNTPTLAEAVKHFQKTGQFLLSTDNPSSYEFEDQQPRTASLERVSEYRHDAFADAATGDNSQVKSVPAASPGDAGAAAPAAPAPTAASSEPAPAAE